MLGNVDSGADLSRVLLAKIPESIDADSEKETFEKDVSVSDRSDVLRDVDREFGRTDCRVPIVFSWRAIPWSAVNNSFRTDTGSKPNKR